MFTPFFKEIVDFSMSFPHLLSIISYFVKRVKRLSGRFFRINFRYKVQSFHNQADDDIQIKATKQRVQL